MCLKLHATIEHNVAEVSDGFYLSTHEEQENMGSLQQMQNELDSTYLRNFPPVFLLAAHYLLPLEFGERESMTRGAAAYSADGAVVPLLQNTPQLFAHGTHEQREERKGLFTHSLTGSEKPSA